MSPVPAPAPVTPGGGHVSTLYDATHDVPLLSADNGVVTVHDNADFHSHGKLIGAGVDYNGGPQPTWFDPSATTWNQKGWFGFFYGGPFGVDQFDFQIGYGTKDWFFVYTGSPVDGGAGFGINGFGSNSFCEVDVDSSGVAWAIRQDAGQTNDPFQIRTNNNTRVFKITPTGGLFATLPTADPHVAGLFWNNAGAVKVSAG